MSNAPARRFLIVGRANAGKTLFVLNFAEYMGYEELTIKFKSNFEDNIKSNTINSFKKTIVSDNPNMTKCLQITTISMPVLKGKKQVEFIDSTGISSGIHYEQDVREGMAQTLTLLKGNHIIMHIIDANLVSLENKIDDVDIELYKYGRKKGNYLILANKLDVKSSETGLKLIQNNLSNVKIINISAMCKTGFDEVKKYVSRIA